MKQYDCIIVGAGPAGITTALYLAQQHISVLVLDKAQFPREKTCGDGLSPRSINILKDLGLYEEFRTTLPVNLIDGVLFSSPEGVTLPINYADINRNNDAAGYTLERKYFDAFLIEKAKAAGIDIREKFTVEKFITEENAVKGLIGFDNTTREKESLYAPLTICAAGVRTSTLKSLGFSLPELKDTSIGIRQYYHNVKDCSSLIELHFVKSIVAGYFWIFPEKDNRANVGIFIPETFRKRHKIDLNKELEQIIHSPQFHDRFANAIPQEKAKAGYLTLGRTPLPQKAGILIIGDAMGVTEHFTGEGIGNAMFSGQCAAKVIVSAFAKNDFSVETLEEFHTLCIKPLLKEFRISAIVNKMKWPWLINFVVRKAAKHHSVMIQISKTTAEERKRWQLLNPFFYLKLLLKK